MFTGQDRPSPNPTYMSETQMAGYLKEIRASKPRPTGSRPPPPSKFGSALRRVETDIAESIRTKDGRPALQQSSSMPIMPAEATAHRRAQSGLDIRSPFLGRAIARPPSAAPGEQDRAGPDEKPRIKRTPSAVYLENGTRWMERQETKSLRQALSAMDLAEEQKVHQAAQDEAAELVWKHQNPNAPYENPDRSNDFRAHLRKGSYNRSHGQDAVPMVVSRSSSGSSQTTSLEDKPSSKRSSVDTTRKVSPPTAGMPGQKSRTPSGKSYGELAAMVKKDIVEARRRTSSGSKRTLSGEKRMFMHPQDRIFEDPETSTFAKPMQNIPDLRPPNSVAVASFLRKNPFARVRMQQDRLERSNSAPVLSQPAKYHSVEIQKNAPSQSRNAQYQSNGTLPTAAPASVATQQDQPKYNMDRSEKEVRSDDIRAATSKLRSDRSQHLPQPTLVSDRPGRPIVSFKTDLKPKEVVLEEVRSNASRPTSSASTIVWSSSPETSKPPIPTINFPEESKSSRTPVPTLVLPDEVVVPTIVLPEEPDFASSANHSASDTPSIIVQAPSIFISAPAVSINGPGFSTRPTTDTLQRPLPTPSQNGIKHAHSSPLPTSTPHFTPSIRQSGALCAHCAMPIAGRVLSAAGERFHPSCFVCHQCHTNLELVAFYPEPEKSRHERVERIRARQSGLEDPAGTDEYADGDESLRFYCHLDFHEFFSPRCKSCKTPIEGEVIVACGAEWHVGHFFCAQCGDPFDSTMPFVEKDGYAWCVGCHTNRYSSKCRKCRKPVTDVVVKALGADWHGACFRCMQCNSEFDDGRYFLTGESSDPVCMKCEERRLKA